MSSTSHLSYSERLRALRLPYLEYRWERDDVLQANKKLHDIDKVDNKQALYTIEAYGSAVAQW